MGFSEAQIEELAADQIALERVKKIFSAGVSVPESEMRKDYEQGLRENGRERGALSP